MIFKKTFSIEMSTLREINTKNQRHYYPGNKINIKNLDFDKILLYERPY